jgi:hypothetical protein
MSIIFKSSVSTEWETHIRSCKLTLSMEKTTVSSENHTKHVNIRCGQKIQGLNVEVGGTYGL